MSTIPASALVKVNPGVLSAGGTALTMSGLALVDNSRAPTGSILSFASGASVTSYFGAGSKEDQLANGGAGLGSGYFGGYDNKTAIPAQMRFAQFPRAAVGAFLRGGPINTLTIPQLQAISGALSVVIDGYTYTGSPNLSAATSYSAAAATIQTALNTSLPAAASTTASIAPVSATFTGSIAGNVMTVTTAPSNPLVAGALLTGTGVTAGNRISSQLSGTAGGIGTYAVTLNQVLASTSLTAAYGTLTVTNVSAGTLSVGQTVAGGTTSAGTQITQLGTGVGLLGTYFLQNSQTVVSGTLTTSGTALAVTFDSVSGGLLITSGALTLGSASTAAYATAAISATLLLTSATGAVLGAGAFAQTPGAFMDALTARDTNWATFFTAFDPDGSSAGGNTQKQAFAAWANGTDDEFAYVCWDTDAAPTTGAAPTSLGAILKTANSSGTIMIWEPTFSNYAAFFCGAVASINWNATNGRITFAGKGQTGLVATVTDLTTYNNLIANGYNCYAAFATAAQQFLQFEPGTASGPFQWADSYVNQINLNAALQLALMIYRSTINSIPYDQDGYDGIEAVMLDPVYAAVKFGSIRTGVTLSNQQALEIDTQAGVTISDTVQQQGWAIVIQDASPQVRQARLSPTILLFYTDGQSVQVIDLSSTLVQ